jgi:hypothetical protein
MKVNKRMKVLSVRSVEEKNCLCTEWQRIECSSCNIKVAHVSSEGGDTRDPWEGEVEKEAANISSIFS